MFNSKNSKKIEELEAQIEAQNHSITRMRGEINRLFADNMVIGGIASRSQTNVDGLKWAFDRLTEYLDVALEHKKASSAYVKIEK